MGTRRPVLLVLLGAGAVVLVAGLTIGLFVPSDEAPSRQDVIARRGAHVMPFDLEATTHVFDATNDGGVQSVVADRAGDTDQIALIRSHLRAERVRFLGGDFGDPAAIHGHDMPGLGILEERADALVITYGDLPTGGRVTYSSDDPAVVAALHDWFAAQLSDHGEHAERRVERAGEGT